MITPTEKPAITPANFQRLDPRDRPEGRSPVMYQTWRNLLFLHWRFDPAEIQATLPEGLYVDTFQSSAWLGIVPFYMRNVRPRFLPPVPGISNFLEINLRTYVFDENGIPGVWFYSLDANQRLAVNAGKTFFSLPYSYAKMKSEIGADNKSFRYSWERPGIANAKSIFQWRSQGPPRAATAGNRDFFLTERYVLYAVDPQSGALYSGRVHHKPYPITEVRLNEWDDSLIAANGFQRPEREPDQAVFSPGVKVEIFSLQKVSGQLPAA